jgi:alpha-amylase/alpha-mannosidase (GH57 family)
MSESPKLKVALLWHMHQPFYLIPGARRFMMPWVRFHGLKDYLDMPLLASQFPKIKVTFNLVPSLLEQLQLYCEGYTDRHLELSRIPSRMLSPDDKMEILTSFFSAHVPTMIEPYARYRQLYRKKESCGTDLRLGVDLFSTSDWRDLQVWSNLTWIDPSFRSESPIRELFEKGRDFSEEDKVALLDFQLGLLKRIIPTYQKLRAEGKIDISFTPYYHPILPLLIDSDCAREAMPNIILPKKRFAYPEDARWHIDKAIEQHKILFEDNLSGMWPSEGSLSVETLKIMAEAGIKWTATDEDILHGAVARDGLDPRRYSPHAIYTLSGATDLKIFFRDRGLSDKIGFVYSSWETERAVADFMGNLRKIREFLGNGAGKAIVPIILDGENAWEYYKNDGADFLKKLYMALSEERDIEVVSFTEAAARMEATTLNSFIAGSWINRNFRVWIGHEEDNTAWEILHSARQALVDFQKSNPTADSARLEKAWRQLYIAEGSDWCWWYGDDHIGEHNDQFDILFRAHVAAIYEVLGINPPGNLLKPIHRAKAESLITLPEALISPKLDGMLTHYYEWSGAGFYDCGRAGGAMHRVDRIINGIYFAFDRDNFYIRVDFSRKINLLDSKKCRIIISFKDLEPKEIVLEKRRLVDKDGYRYIYGDLLEIEFGRKKLLPSGSGRLEFFVMLYLGEQLMEKWPVDDPIVIDIPEKEREIFWQV